MKVFLSWSGDLSHQIAIKFKWWLPKVIQVLEPYISSEDIEGGERWSESIAKELEQTSVGVICVTRGNVNKPWINFESGALSKSIENSRVIPFLYNMKKSELKGPLLQFQAVVFDKAGAWKIVDTLNNACPTKLTELDLKETFDVWWPMLESALKELSDNLDDPTEEALSGRQVNEGEILEEILDLARNQQKLLSSPENLLPKSLLEYFGTAMQHGDLTVVPTKELDRLFRSLRMLLPYFVTKLENGELEASGGIWDSFALLQSTAYEMSRFSEVSGHFGNPIRLRRQTQGPPGLGATRHRTGSGRSNQRAIDVVADGIVFDPSEGIPEEYVDRGEDVFVPPIKDTP